MEFIGCDRHGNKLKLGDRCRFKIVDEGHTVYNTYDENHKKKAQEHTGTIVYDRYNFAYAFDIDNLPIELLIWRVDTHSIEKI